MDIRNCRTCGKMFNYVTGPFICPACKEALEQKFQEVKKYIQDNRGVGVKDVAEACEVDPGQIRQWIREERLEFAEGSLELGCEKCGKPITSGRFCAECKNSMANSLNNVYQKKAPVKNDKPDSPGGPKMRFI